MIIIIVIASFLASMLVRSWMTRTYAVWSTVPNQANVDGFTAARNILDRNGLHDVKLDVSEGMLTDHYIPSLKMIRLSSDINSQPSVASAAVAAHECGHALQDAEGYKPLKAKAMLMPLANMGNQFGLILSLGGGIFSNPFLLNSGLLMMLLGMLMPLLTLPIEFDASKRALVQLTELDMLNDAQHQGAKSMLRAAALTYVAGAASSSAIVALVVMRLLKR